MFDFLIVMGGPMSVHDEDKYPWLKKEKEFIRSAIENKKIVIGICLGSQLIAEVLGSKVYQNKEKEIGWFPIKFSHSENSNKILNSLPQELEVFHWHGDTFNLPKSSIHLAESKCTKNQAFVLDKIIGLQFHLEITEKGLEKMINYCKGELDGSGFVQSEDEIKNSNFLCKKNNEFMFKLLDNITETF